jgi:hypothetical protein
MFTATCFGQVYGHRAVAAEYRIIVCWVSLHMLNN